MRFQWDRHNREKLKAHGMTTEDAEAIWRDPNGAADAQPNDLEPRWKTIGQTNGRRGIVVWTTRGDAVRVITAWWESRIHKRDKN